MIELAVVDLAGTTVRDDGAVEGAFVEALADAGVTPVDGALDHIRSTMGMSKIVVFRDLLADEAQAQQANAAFELAYSRRVAAGEVEPLPGAEDALGTLRAQGVRISLTTGFSAATRVLLLDALGWTELADLALSPDDALRGRPAPDLVLASIIRLRVTGVDAVAVVGDTVNDLVAGTRAGASIVAGVLTGAHDRATLSSAPHTHLLDSIGDLPAVVRLPLAVS
jgi:phosphonatase-like hydrolase